MSDGSRFPFVRSAYNYDADAASVEAGLACDPDGMVTKQSFREECDINEIVRRFGITGELPQGISMPVSGDFTAVTDFQSAMNEVIRAQEEFMLLPAEVRYRFANDPARLIAFLEDGNNRDEAIKLGIVAKPAERTRDAVQAIDELAKVLKKE